MWRFVDVQDTQTVDLGDGDWVKLPTAISFESVAALDLEDEKKPTIARMVSMFLAFVKEWNLKDRDGNVAPIDEAHIRALDVPTMKKVMEVITGLVGATEGQKKA